MTPWRVAYLSSDPGIPPDGTKGASVHFREMAQALRNAGAGLDVFMADKKRRGSDPTSLGAHLLPFPRAAGTAGELHQLAASAAMFERMQRHGPHDAVYERLSLFGAAGLAYARALDAPLILEVNAPLWEEAARFRSLHLRRTARALALDTMTGAHRVLAVSKVMAEMVIAEGVAPSAVEVMPNGVNAALFDAARPAKRPASLRDRPVLVFAGSLKQWHGVDFLVEAFRHCRRRRPLGLWIVGDGPMRGELELATRDCSEDVVFEGSVAHDRIPEILKAADVAVAPYPANSPSYFSPLKVVEALAAHCPQRASRTPCVAELAAQSDAIALFEPGDVHDFSRALEDLLARSHSASSAARVPAELSWDHKAKRVLAWMREDAGSRKSLVPSGASAPGTR